MKRKPKLLYAVMAALMLCATTEAMAQQYICDLVTLTGSGTVPTPYKIAFMGVTPCTDCGGVPGKTGFLWDYKVTNSPGSITQFSILAPVCSEDLGLFAVGGGQILKPGEGDSTSMFGVGDFQDQVSRLALNSSSDYILGVTREAGQTPTSIQIRVSKNLYYCPAIPGPDCPRPSEIPALRQKNIVIGGMPVKLVIDMNQCTVAVSQCTPDFTTCQPLPPVDVQITSSDGTMPEWLKTISDIDGNLMCGWGRIFVSGSPECTFMPSGGSFVKVGTTCTCTSNSQCWTLGGYTCRNNLCAR